MKPTYRLSGILLDESVKNEIQLFRTGTFFHSQYGKFAITPDVLKTMESNFQKKVRGIDIPVNYKHDSDSVAAGWMKKVFTKNNGNELWAEVDWTPNGQKILADKEFRYISPEFSFEYQDNETLKNYGPTLLGAGLTNIPTIKNMEPVILSEYKLDEMGDCVKDKIPELINSGHPQDQAVAIAYSKCRKEMGMTETKQKNEKNPEEVKAMDYGSIDVESMNPEEMKVLIKELLAKMIEMKGQAVSTDKQMADMKAEKQLSEKKAKFNLMLTEGKVCKAQEEAYLADDMVKFAEHSQSIKLSTSGSSQDAKSSIGNPEDIILELAQKKIADGSFKNIGDAIHMTLSENPELANKLY